MRPTTRSPSTALGPTVARGSWCRRREPRRCLAAALGPLVAIGRLASAGSRPSAVEEGGGIPSTGACGERGLSVQIDHRTCSASPNARRSEDRGAPRLQRAESDDRAWPAGVVQYSSVNVRWGWGRFLSAPNHATTPYSVAPGGQPDVNGQVTATARSSPPGGRRPECPPWRSSPRSTHTRRLDPRSPSAGALPSTAGSRSRSHGA